MSVRQQRRCREGCASSTVSPRSSSCIAGVSPVLRASPSRPERPVSVLLSAPVSLRCSCACHLCCLNDICRSSWKRTPSMLHTTCCVRPSRDSRSAHRRTGPSRTVEYGSSCGVQAAVADDGERHVYTVTVHGTKKSQGNTFTCMQKSVVYSSAQHAGVQAGKQLNRPNMRSARVILYGLGTFVCC